MKGHVAARLQARVRPCIHMLLAVGSLVAGEAFACGSIVEAYGVSVELTCEPFEKTRHRLTYRDGTLLRIDGSSYSGTDGTVPKVAVRSLRFRIDGNAFTVPQALVRSLYEPHAPPHTMRTLSVQRTGDFVLAQFSGGDGAGAYRTMWVINSRSSEVTRVMYEHPDPQKAKVVRARLKPEPPTRTGAQKGLLR